MNIIKTIINSAKKAWRGEEKLWIVFWLWGVLLYFGSFFVGGFYARILLNYLGDFNYFLAFSFSFCMSILSVIYIFIYPVIFSVSMWRCSIKTDCLIAKVVVFIFIPFHIFISTLTIWGLFLYGSSLIKYFLKTIN